MTKEPLLVCVCGATATGKSDLAFQLALHFKTEIISFDSVQVYKELNIGTAKPSEKMRAQVRHHLIDELLPNIPFTAGDFRRRALEIIDSSKKNQSILVLVGGTGFYLQALLKGMYPSPKIDPSVRATLEDRLKIEGLDKLHKELCQLDSAYGKKIHGNDQYRILRALEVITGSGKTMTEIQNEFVAHEPAFQTLLLGLQREKPKLLESVTARTESMVKEGLVEETQGLLKKYGDTLRPLESVGYKETVDFIKGNIKQDELIPQIVKSTMALAKRQKTWFKRDAKIHWLDPDLTSPTLLSSAIDLVHTVS